MAFVDYYRRFMSSRARPEVVIMLGESGKLKDPILSFKEAVGNSSQSGREEQKCNLKIHHSAQTREAAKQLKPVEITAVVHTGWPFPLSISKSQSMGTTCF